MASQKESPLAKLPSIDQIDNPNLESISGMDAAFLYGETDTSPMHIGSVLIIEGPFSIASNAKNAEAFGLCTYEYRLSILGR